MGLFTYVFVDKFLPGDKRDFSEATFETKDLDYYRYHYIQITRDFELIPLHAENTKCDPDEYHNEWIGLFNYTNDSPHFKAYIEHNYITKVEEISEQEILFSEEFE